jgi:hypothetical protein
MSTPNKSPCGICAKTTEKECSHIDCPNRRRVTAQPVGSEVMTRGQQVDGYGVNGRAIIRKPYYFDD